MMRFFAVLSDIHANYQALLAVEQDALRQAGDQVSFVSLGDVVDYGPQPNECLAWVLTHSCIAIRGNHDRYAAGEDEPFFGIDQQLWPISRWTRRILHDQHKELIRLWPPMVVGPEGLRECTLFHSSLVGEDGRIDDFPSARTNLAALATPLGMFGHTHYQGYFWDDDLIGLTIGLTCAEAHQLGPQRAWRPVPFETWTPLPAPEQPLLLNPGSVGQPRSHSLLSSVGASFDNRAAYMLLRMREDGTGEYQFRRVAYDVATTIHNLAAITERPAIEQTDPGLADLVDRLIRILRG
jgi:predicted phosphodiesterase